MGDVQPRRDFRAGSSHGIEVRLLRVTQEKALLEERLRLETHEHGRELENLREEHRLEKQSLQAQLDKVQYVQQRSLRE